MHSIDTLLLLWNVLLTVVSILANNSCLVWFNWILQTLFFSNFCRTMLCIARTMLLQDTRCLSIRPSVCLSVTIPICVQSSKLIVEIVFFEVNCSNIVQFVSDSSGFLLCFTSSRLSITTSVFLPFLIPFISFSLFFVPFHVCFSA